MQMTACGACCGPRWRTRGPCPARSPEAWRRARRPSARDRPRGLGGVRTLVDAWRIAGCSWRRRGARRSRGRARRRTSAAFSPAPSHAPHDLAALVVGDEREVVVLALPADLVDPDVIEIVEPVGIELVVADALDDPPDRVPVDPEHPLDRRLVGPRRQPRDQALEVARELRARPGERDALGARPVLRAPQPPAAAVDLKPPDPEIEMPPHRVLRPRVLARPGRVVAQRADQPPAAQARPRPSPGRARSRTFLTHTPGRRRSLENAVVTRTLSLLASR